MIRDVAIKRLIGWWNGSRFDVGKTDVFELQVETSYWKRRRMFRVVTLATILFGVAKITKFGFVKMTNGWWTGGIKQLSAIIDVYKVTTCGVNNALYHEGHAYNVFYNLWFLPLNGLKYQASLWHKKYVRNPIETKSLSPIIFYLVFIHSDYLGIR